MPEVHAAAAARRTGQIWIVGLAALLVGALGPLSAFAPSSLGFAALGLVGLAVVALSFWRPPLTVYLILATNLWNPVKIVVMGASVTTADLVVLLALVATVVRQALSPRPGVVRVPPRSILYATILYLAAGALSLAAAGPYLAAAAVRFAHVAEAFVLLFVFVQWFGTPDRARRFVAAFVAIMVAVSLVGVVVFAYAKLAGANDLVARGYALPFTTLPSETGEIERNVNLAVPGLKVQALTLSLGFLAFAHGRRYRLVYSISALVIGLGLFTTLSRGALLTAAVGAAVVILHRGVTRRLVMLALAAGVLVAGIGLGVGRSPVEMLVGTGRSHTLQLRADLWSAAVNVYLASPVLGVGIGQYNRYSGRYLPEDFPDTYRNLSAHNDFLDRLSETGTVGAITYMLLGATLITWSYRARRLVDERDKPLAYGLIGCVVAFVASGFYANGFPGVAPFLSLAMLMPLVRQGRPRNQAMLSPTVPPATDTTH